MNVKDTIEEIRLLLQSNEQGLSPKLRKLHGAYLRFATELYDQVEECRQIEKKQSLADAASHASSFDPPLGERIDMLDFPEKEQFAALCQKNMLPGFPEIDANFVKKLSSPLEKSERRNQELLRSWRKTARTGTASQRMALLREIVASGIGDNAAWLRNLLETEKIRYDEIAKELQAKALWELEDLPTLEKINLELHSPLLRSKPTPALISKLQECLVPLQKKQVAAQIEEQLDVIQACLATREDQALAQEYQNWLRLASHPLAEISPEQRQFIEDIKKYLQNKADEQARQQEFMRLNAEILQAIEKNAPYQDIATAYSKLKLLDLPISQAMQDNIERLAYENQQNEKRSNARRIIFGTIIAIISVVMVFTAIFFIQRRNSINNCTKNLSTFIQDKDFKGALEYYDSLLAKSPKLAQNHQVLALKTEAEQKYAEFLEKNKLARQEFAILCQDIKQELSGDFLENKQFNEKLKRLEALKDDLDEEGRKELTLIIEETSLRQKQLIKEHERKFIEQRDKIFNEANNILETLNHDTDLAATEKLLKQYSDTIDKFRAESTIDNGLRQVTSEQWDKKMEVITYAITAEKEQRVQIEKLTHPKDLQTYLEALKDAKHTLPDFASKFAQATNSIDIWENCAADLQEIDTFLARDNYSFNHESFIGEQFLDFFQHDNRALFSNFASAVVQRCNYFQLIATDDNQAKFFFYMKNHPLIERDKRNRKYIKNISFEIDACTNPRDKYFVFISSKTSQGQIIFKDVWAGQHRDISMPHYFISLEDFQKPQMCEFFLLAQDYLNLLNQDIPEEKRLTITLQKTKDLQNPVVKCLVSLQILDALVQASLLSKPDTEALAAKIRKTGLDKVDWKIPDATKKYAGEINKFETILQHFSIDEIAKTRDFRELFLRNLYARHLIPAGIVIIKPDNTTSFVSFLQTTPQELVVINGKSLELINSKLQNGQQPSSEHDLDLLFNGQVLWTFSDGKTTEEFLMNWRQKASEQNLKINLVPNICPIQLHSFLM